MTLKHSTTRSALVLLLLATAGASVAPAQTGAAPKTIIIDATRRQKISPYIYGANFPEWQKMGMRFPMARQGGNRMSGYNWENNASNAGSDWHHQNDSHLATSDEPGYYSRLFLKDAQKHGATPILTIPMTGYVAADKKGDGDVNQTPNYLQTRFRRSVPKKNSTYVYPPNSQDGAVYQDEYVAWIEKIKAPGSTVWYSLDNEPDIWSGTHARIVPKTPTYAQFIERSIQYATAIKSVAPRSMVLGPVSYGWQGFRRFQDAADANGRDFLNVYMDAMHAAEKKSGKRLLDVLDIHFYPEARGDNKRVTEAFNTPGIAAARIQAPRSLWDSTYVEDSWITQSSGNKPIALLPGLRKQIAAHYPGTKLAVTEWNYGGGNHISGAIAHADVLGVYGRNGVYAASIWGMGTGDTAHLAAFRAFLNYDGRGSRMGDLGLAVSGETPVADSVYAALDSRNPKSMTVVVINKTATARPMRLQLRGFVPSTAAAYVTTQETLAAGRQSPVVVQSGILNFTAPPLSVSTLSVRAR